MSQITQILNMRTKKKENLRIETNVLTPQNINTNECVFSIPRKGLLDGGSRLIVPLACSVATTRLTLPAGAYCVIQTATLRTSKGVVISQCDDVDYLMTINNQFVDPEVRKRRSPLVNGSQLSYHYTDTAAHLFGGKLCMVGPLATDIESRYKLNVDAATIPSSGVEYSIKLSELFPQLFPFTIPLFLLQDNLQLHIQWTDDASTGRRCISSDGNQANAGRVKVCQNSVKFVSDHLFFGASTMDALTRLNMSKEGIVIPYSDFNLIKNHYPTAHQPEEGSVEHYDYRRNMGLANLRLRFMLIHQQNGSIADSEAVGDNGKAGYGKYNSTASMAKESWQIMINNENWFPREITTSPRLYNELSQVYGGIPATIAWGAYTAEGSVNDERTVIQGGGLNEYDVNANLCAWTDRQFFGTAQTHNLGGMAIRGFNFAKSQEPVGSGIAVGRQPLELLYGRDYTNADYNNILQRIFCCVERILVIKGGVLFTSGS